MNSLASETSRYRSSRLFLVGASTKWRSRRSGVCIVRSEDDLRRGFLESPKGSVWLTERASWFGVLAGAGACARPMGDRRLLVLRSLEDVTQHVLGTWFRFVVTARDGISLLNAAALLDVLAAPNRDELFVGAGFDRAEKVVVLYRGSVEPLVVPASWFQGAARKRIDLQNVTVVDHGQTVRIGDWEAAADAILYEFDADYRGKAKKRAFDADVSLGGAIRRLRLQKGLTQSDLGLPLKTVARIERGEVKRPQAPTLRTIAARLGVSVDELGSY